MTGKQFKEFANQVPDNAVVERRSERYPNDWSPMKASEIQARLVIVPSSAEQSEEVEA